KEEETIEKLLTVENAANPVEIVIHVNMLKEGWDVTNLYTIIPLRAANARTLIEQSIGRGLRLPYGKRTGVEAVDRLNIVAHDRFQEIVDEANNPNSPIRLKKLILDDDDTPKKQISVEVTTVLDGMLGGANDQGSSRPTSWAPAPPPAFSNPVELKIAQATERVIAGLARQPGVVPNISYINNPDVQALVVEEVSKQFDHGQLELEGIASSKPDFKAIVAKASALVVQQTINIPVSACCPRARSRQGFAASRSI
ncbi:MAG: type III restriction endonuclease subunit R, partial [Hyphomonadaceae bacterium]|nr:type III restriction endonuclease subunit R [Hyphomonadaceae bacterium]